MCTEYVPTASIPFLRIDKLHNKAMEIIPCYQGNKKKQFYDTSPPSQREKASKQGRKGKIQETPDTTPTLNTAPSINLNDPLTTPRKNQAQNRVEWTDRSPQYHLISYHIILSSPTHHTVSSGKSLISCISVHRNHETTRLQ